MDPVDSFTWQLQEELRWESIFLARFTVASSSVVGGFRGRGTVVYRPGLEEDKNMLKLFDPQKVPKGRGYFDVSLVKSIWSGHPEPIQYLDHLGGGGGGGTKAGEWLPHSIRTPQLIHSMKVRGMRKRRPKMCAIGEKMNECAVHQLRLCWCLVIGQLPTVLFCSFFSHFWPSLVHLREGVGSFRKSYKRMNGFTQAHV